MFCGELFLLTVFSMGNNAYGQCGRSIVEEEVYRWDLIRTGTSFYLCSGLFLFFVYLFIFQWEPHHPQDRGVQQPGGPGETGPGSVQVKRCRGLI